MSNVKFIANISHIFSCLLILIGTELKAQSDISRYGTDCIGDPQAFSIINCNGCTNFIWSVSGDHTEISNLNGPGIGGFSWNSAGTHSVSVSYDQGFKSIQVTINPEASPEVTISFSPTGSIVYQTPITFTRTSSIDGGSTPTYQWYLNAVAQPGETGAQYVRTDLQNGDQVFLRMISNEPCPGPGYDDSDVFTADITYLIEPPTVQNVTTEYNTSATLTANGAAAGETYRWYTAPTGGTYSEGLTFNTPPLTTQTTYFVSRRNAAGDESRRVTQTVSLGAAVPTMPTVTLNTCGPKVLTRGTPPTGVTWYWVGTNETGTSMDSSPTYTINNANNDIYYLRAFVDNTWGPAVGITVTTDPVDLVLTRYDAAEVQATNSITLKPGFTVPAGKSFTASIGITSECNDVYNWSEQITYDETGAANSRSKVYADGFGEGLQSQSIDFESNMVWVSQPVYDFQNQPAIATLPAPIREKDFIYKKNFVANASSGQPYSPLDFDNPGGSPSGTILNPNAVSADPGTLGWYYSSNNNLEPATPTTNFPYSRSYTPPGPDPMETTSASPGDNYKMGSGHEVEAKKKTFIKSELSHYFANRQHFVTTPLPVSQEGITLLSQDGSSVGGYAHVGNVFHTLVTQSNETYIKVLSNGSEGNPGARPANTPIAVTPGEIYVYRVKGYRDAAGLVALGIKNAVNNEDIVWPGATLPGGATNEDWIENTFVVPEGCTSIELSILWSVHPMNGDAFYINAVSLTRVINSESMVYGYKTISKDPDGKKAVTFSDADGRMLASAVIISESGTNPTTYTYDNWSYSYYNEIGQVVATVAPNGISSGQVSSFVTYTKYDHLGRVIETSSPDEGMSQIVYNLDGQIRFSQNEEQRNYIDPETDEPAPKFSYTNYDKLGRLIESGEYISKGSNPFVFEPHTTLDPAPSSVLRVTESTGFTEVSRNKLNPDLRYSEYNYIEYDITGSGFAGGPSNQTNLFGQISKTENAIYKTWYSYDEFGQMTWTKQNIPGLGDKIIEYTYDYYGNVTQITYQKDATTPPADAFYHHYTYDLNQRLVEVHTSKDGVNKTLQAKYIYYLHGPLKRVELAGNVQGIDYVYNIDGSLKMINHADPALDPGKDGVSGEHANFMADVFGEILDYNSNDYTGANYNDGTLTLDTYPDQFGGSVKAIRWHSPTDMHVPRAYAFTYDNLNQMKNADWGNVTGTGGAYGFSVNGSQAYKENIGLYDNNGNIKALGRKDKNGNALADYVYTYTQNTNKLGSITDGGNPFLSYEYNSIGQMIKQTEGNKILEVAYNVYGLVKEVRKLDKEENNTLTLVQKITHDYDDRGDRVKTTVVDGSNVEQRVTYYVSDASGSSIATYEKPDAESTLLLAELPVYGADRIAMYKPQVNTTFYEISDHLGNVRGVIGNPATLPPYFATLEDNGTTLITNPRVREGEAFKNIWETAVDREFMNHTVPSEYTPSPNEPEPQYSAYLRWVDGQDGIEAEDKSVGPAIGLNVEPGDKIDMEAWVKYEKKIGNYSRPNIVAAMASILGNNFVGTQEGLDVLTKATQIFQNGISEAVGVPFPGNGNEGDDLPHAYLYYLLFDKNFNPITAGWSRVPENGVGGFDPGNEAFSVHGKLSIPTVTITEPGYIYVFVANESEDTQVWFDDVKVNHQRSSIVAGADYYPFGLAMKTREITREGYRYGYQGQYSEEDKETGWNSFELRMYDSRVGRWLSVDPYGQYNSPYMSMGNDPIVIVDPNGGIGGPYKKIAPIPTGDVAVAVAIANGTTILEAVPVTPIFDQAIVSRWMTFAPSILKTLPILGMKVLDPANGWGKLNDVFEMRTFEDDGMRYDVNQEGFIERPTPTSGEAPDLSGRRGVLKILRKARNAQFGKIVELGGRYDVKDIWEAGRRFVGKNHLTNFFRDGKIRELISKDGLRRFRPPQFKEIRKYKQANYEIRANKKVRWKNKAMKTNVHVVPK